MVGVICLLYLVTSVELVVLSPQLEELVVGTLFDDAAVVEDDDEVGIADSGEAVGDDECGAPLHQSVHAPLYEGLRAGVDAAGGLVEDEHRGI